MRHPDRPSNPQAQEKARKRKKLCTTVKEVGCVIQIDPQILKRKKKREKEKSYAPPSKKSDASSR
jgi:hypothetical protein